MGFIRGGDEGAGQTQANIRVCVATNFRGDIQIVRKGERVSWLDLSPDAAVDLAYQILLKVGRSGVPTIDGRLLELSR